MPSNYEQLIKHLSEDFLPNPSGDQHFKQKIGKLIEDMKLVDELASGFEQQQVEQLQQIDNMLNLMYQNYSKQKRISESNVNDVNHFIKFLVDFFENRYHVVNRNTVLRKVYKRYGYDFLFRNNIEINGLKEEVKGPALIISTHDELHESFVFQKVLEEHMFWVADLYLGTSSIFRVHGIPGLKQLWDSLGYIEVRRKKPTSKITLQLFRKTLSVFEKNKILGIFPLGARKVDRKNWNDYNHYGFVDIVEYAQKRLNITIPIYPVGIRREGKNSFVSSLLSYTGIKKGKTIINFGEPFTLPSSIPDKETYAQEKIAYLYELREK